MVADVPVTMEDATLFFGLSFFYAAVAVTVVWEAETMDAVTEVIVFGSSFFSSAVAEWATDAVVDSASKNRQKRAVTFSDSSFSLSALS